MSKYTCIDGKFSLEQLLDFKTIKELKEIMYCLGYKFKSGVRKALMINDICEIMRNEPEQIIKNSFSFELKAFLDVIEGRMSIEYASESGMLFELNRFGLIYSLKFPNKEIKLLFESDMAEKLLPLIPAELESREKNGFLQIEKIALGEANIYGYTNFFHLLENLGKIEKRLKINYDTDVLLEAFAPIINYCNSAGRSDLELPFLSPFVSFLSELNDDISDARNLEPKEFDIDTILKYGEMPYPEFPLESAEKLKKYLEEHKELCIHSIEYTMREIWIKKQEDITDSLMSAMQNLFVFHSIEELNKLMSLVLEFSNNVPFWKLQGNSSHEVYEKDKAALQKEGRMPKIVMGPNMRARGVESFEQLMDMADRGEEIPPMKPVGKVGRNDPCPCGSGKKFKHCCGR